MAETSDKLLPGFEKCAVAVKQVAGQKNDIHALTHRKLRKSAEQNSLLASADGGLLADYLKEHGYNVIVRGLRGAQDVPHEFTNAYYNRAFCPKAETVFLPARPEWTFVSSSAVREAVRYGADVSRWVPPCVARAMREKYRK